MEQIKVFLDSNVLFSIAYSGIKSKSYVLYELQDKNLIKIYISHLVQMETLYNMQLKKQDQMDLLKSLLENTELLHDIDIHNKKLENLPDADRVILSTAIYHKMDYFLTGNSRDFSEFYGKRIGKTLILTPGKFLLR